MTVLASGKVTLSHISQMSFDSSRKICICDKLREIASSYTLNPLRFSLIRNWYFDEKSDQSLIIFIIKSLHQ